MKQLILKRGPLFWSAVFLLLFIGISFFVTPSKPKEYPDFVSNSPSPTGVKAFYTYLDDEKEIVGRWSYTPERMQKTDKKQLLLMIEPSFIPDEKIMDEYISFMEAGNTILLLKMNPDGMFDIQTEAEWDDSESGNVEDAEGKTYQAVKNSPFRILSNEEEDVLLEDSAGIVAMKKHYRNGTLITAVAPDWITNDQITDEDHIELLFSLMDDEAQNWDAIYFDEYMLQPDNVTSFTALYPTWLLLAGLQAIFLVMLWLWYKGKRFGTIITPREATVRFSDERIRALAAWYRRGRLYYDSFAMQADYLRTLMQERWGIPYHKNWIDIAAALEKKVSTMTHQDVDSFLKGIAQILTKKRMNKKEYLYWSKKLDTLRKEVEDK